MPEQPIVNIFIGNEPEKEESEIEKALKKRKEQPSISKMMHFMMLMQKLNKIESGIRGLPHVTPSPS